MNVMIAGASRGIGLGLVTALLAQGHRVVAVARDPAGSGGLQALASVAPLRNLMMREGINPGSALKSLRSTLREKIGRKSA